ncbi:type II toxin-antitoxin system VapC family toxin [Enterovirga sp. CN4-39]|uniref:type II toxin-antitoxin system VapC family toxin n=1 Tax=Enterovirga sp. CN4-39 TaxID=3400910 RepID=UPI003C0E7CDE
MRFLIDTNVISEVRKGSRCDPHVSGWWASVEDADLALSTLVVGELRKGVDLARRSDPAKAEALEIWLDKVQAAFSGTIIPIDLDAAREWGRMSAIRPVPVVDCLLAASAKARGLTLVTRNEAHVRDLGVEVLNPFAQIQKSA